MGQLRAWRPGQGYLLDGEISVVSTRLHWIVVWKPVAVMTGVLLLAVVLGGLGDVRIAVLIALVIVVCASYVGYRLLEWYHTYFEVTDKRLLMHSGLLTTRIDMMPVSKVTDMSYEKPLLGKILDFGTFILESAGQDQALSSISHLPDSDRLYRETLAVIFGTPTEAQVERFEQDRAEHEREEQREWQEYGQYWDEDLKQGSQLDTSVDGAVAQAGAPPAATPTAAGNATDEMQRPYGQRRPDGSEDGTQGHEQTTEQWWDNTDEASEKKEAQQPIYGRKPRPTSDEN